MNYGLNFIKIISSSSKLRLPGESIARVQEIRDDKVMVRDIHSNLWSLEIEKDGDELWFKKGWPQFYEDKCLEPMDFVMFRYVRDNLFDVRVLGRDTCEKKGLGGPRVVKEEAEEFSAEEEESDEDEEEEEMEVKRSWKKKKKKAAVDWYGADIFKSGVATKPKNPYFVSRTRQRGNELYIPKDVIGEQKLKIPTKLAMVDGRGRKWEEKVKMWKDGRVWCSRGWKSLCRANNIGAADACICEFVQRPHCILYMRVQPLPLAAS